MTVYRYTEGVCDDEGKVDHIPYRMEVNIVVDLQKECEKFGLPPAIFRGKSPWHICKSKDYPLMAFEVSEIIDVFDNPPISANYLKLSKINTRGHLIYCRQLNFLKSAELYCCDQEISQNKSLEKYLYENKIDDRMVMNDFDENNIYVKWRIDCWDKKRIMPQQYFTFGWGESIHLLRLSRIHGFNLQQAFDFMYLNRIEKKRK